MKDTIAFKEISEQMVSRYSQRYKKLGYHVQTLGWGNTEQQTYRFQQTLEGINFSNQKSILDIGCGFGDYLALLKAQNKEFQNYIGWDINPDLISEAQKIWSEEQKARFEVANIGETALSQPVADAAIMLGVLNLNLKDKVDNYQYSFNFIKNAFSLVNEVLVVDFLSDKLTDNYPKEDFVFYHNPAKMLDFALSLTPNVVLKHNYAAIPQKEFMLFLYK
ncbi:class I SAM-dependent methyltransferase [Bernardetia sp.]|uniref:class I SAM-dependent methyltransferase n=1 Tax=Bernardetia sp. TaxID=1937974 RepID=UPI0025BF6F7F|nr:class I SAM-dependent methyltransferase [Bernardetia sp.]